MKQLMTHVERIVRPVVAFAPRKLRMRRELLGHLEQALEEERGQLSGDGSAAIERAKRRLGEPAELTAQLQQTVPFLERALMSRLPISRRFEQWEIRAGNRIYGRSAPRTMGHRVVLGFAAGVMTGLPWYTPAIVRQVLRNTGSPAHVALFFIGVLSCLWAMLAMSYRMVNAAAESARPLGRASVIAPAAALLLLQVAYEFVVAEAAVDRPPTAADVFVGLAISLTLVACSLFLARRIAHRRQPYDEWLTLDIAV